jgi:glycosyl transferase, family 25
MRTQDRIIPACYVLTLDLPGGKRYESTSNQLARFSIQPSFVEGIRFGLGEVAPQYSPWLNLLHMKRRMTQGEISVYLGHRKIWKQMLNDGHEIALVLEDDFFIQNDEAFVQAIADAMTVAPHWDIVKFFDFRPKRIIQSYRINQTEFVLHKYTGSGCVAYLIKTDKASILLNQSVIFRPIDEDWSHPWEHNLRILSVNPNPVTEIAPALGGSLLERERNHMKAASRNLLRSLYGNLLTINKNARSLSWKRKFTGQLILPFNDAKSKAA